ncbi:MAG: hypothetical protein ACFFB0_12930 [Promethearchaeota archaeon]
MISKKVLKICASILNIIGCIQFIILTSIAMLYYTGGTYADPTTTNYQFCYNFFSDLGRTVAHSGNPNKIAFILFLIALSIWGLLQIQFYIALTFLFKHNINLKYFSYTGSILGVLAGICYIGIAFTPSNLLNPLHDLFVVIAFSSIFLSILFYSIAFFKNKNLSRLYAIALIVSACILAIYFVLLYLYPNHRTPKDLFIQVTGQKIMIYTLLVSGILLGYASLKYNLS